MRASMLLVTLLAIAIIGASCSPSTQPEPGPAPVPANESSPNPDSSSAPGGDQTGRGGIMVLVNRGDPPGGFDSMRTSSIALHHVAGGLFGAGNLVRRCRENMYLVCSELAKDWVVNPGLTEWTFFLRDDVLWHDGTPFTAEDAKFWFDLAVFGSDVGGKTRAPAYFQGELGVVEKVEVLGHNALRVTLRQRNTQFLEVLANPRLKIAHPRHLMQPRLDKGEVSVSPLDIGLVGTGPFKLLRYDRGSRVQLRRFDRYWEQDAEGNPLPYLDGIDFIIMPDPLAMDAAFRTGRLDGGARGEGHYLTVERQAGYIRDLGDDVFFGEMEGGMFRLAFNVLKPGPWQDRQVRRAISLWIDQQESIPTSLGGFGWTSPSLGPENPYKNKNFVNWPKFDLRSLDEKRAEARRLLAEAGYADGFSMGHLCRAQFSYRCEFLQAQLAGLNIDLRLHLVDEGEWNRARVTLDYDTQQGALTPSLVPEGTESVYGRFSQNPDAYSKHEDPQVEALYTRLRDALSLQQRIDIWRQLERHIYVDQAYIVPIAESIQVVPYRSHVKGIVIPPEDGHGDTDFATVWLDRRR